MAVRDQKRIDPLLGGLAQAYRKGLECDSAYLSTVAGFVGGTPLCRAYTSRRSLSSPPIGLIFWLIDWARLMGSAAVVLVVVLMGWGRRLAPTGTIFVYSQDRLRRLIEFLEPEVAPLPFSMNVLRLLRDHSPSGTFIDRIPRSRVFGLALRATALQFQFWAGFVRRPDWRLVAYGIPCWGRAVEFLCLREVVLSSGRPASVWSTAILDRTISWLSELRRLDPFFLGVIQHGSFEGSRVPHRLEVDRLICYPWSGAFYREYYGDPLEIRLEPGLLRLQTRFSLLSESR